MCRSIDHRRVIAAALAMVCASFVGAVAADRASQTGAAADDAVVVAIGGAPRPLATGRAGYYGYGEPLTDEVLAGWDIDVRPDGEGLPPGAGSVSDGESIYEAQCAVCHGVFGEGVDRWPPLAGGDDTLADSDPEKTVGSYWPYATTLWDYIHRAMPFYQPQSLSDDEVYAVTAYVLYLNDIVEDDFVAQSDTLAAVQMPNRDGFFLDPRPDSPNSRCMSDCRDPSSIKVTWDATEMGVTPIGHLNDPEEPANDAPTSPAGPESVGRSTYQQACAVCHEAGVGGAPVPGDTAAWQTRVAQGEVTLVRHAIEGYQGQSGYMPAKGGQMHLADDAVAAAVRYMLDVSGSDR